MIDHYPSWQGSADDAAGTHLAVAGNPPPAVRRIRATADGTLGPDLAQLVLQAYTVTGDVVLDLDDDRSFAAAANATGRRHHALGGARYLVSMAPAAGYVDLILLRWPRRVASPHLLLAACRCLLGSGGVLVVAASLEQDRRSGHLSALHGAATTAGLGPIDHIVAIDPRPLPGDGRGSAAADDRPRALPQPHSDVLLFSPRLGAPTTGGRAR
jgi:hypothetical protein